jgi:hypothetical protein
MRRSSVFNTMFVAQQIADDMRRQGWVVFEYAVDAVCDAVAATDGSPNMVRETMIRTFARHSRRVHG